MKWLVYLAISLGVLAALASMFNYLDYPLQHTVQNLNAGEVVVIVVGRSLIWILLTGRFVSRYIAGDKRNFGDNLLCLFPASAFLSLATAPNLDGLPWALKAPVLIVASVVSAILVLDQIRRLWPRVVAMKSEQDAAPQI